MALVQSATATGTGSSLSFGTTPAAGHVLLAAAASPGGGAEFSQPSGWTSLHYFSGSVFSGEVWYKISDGTESSVDITTGVNGNFILAEYDDAVAGGLITPIGTDETNINTAVTSQGTGSVTATGDGIAFAIFWGDGLTTLDGGVTYSNSFAEDVAASGSSARGGVWLASKSVSSGTISCTRSCTDTGDEMVGAMLVFLASAGGGGSVTEITVTDGVYFYDGPPERAAESVRQDALTISDAAAHDLSRMAYDSIYLSDQRLLDLSRVVADGLFLDDQYYSILDRVLFDALLLASMYTAETSGGGVTEIAVLDALLLASTYARDNEAQFADSLLMSDAAFREAFTALSDSLALIDDTSRVAELTSTDAVLLSSLVARAAEVLVQEALLLGDDVTAQRINAAAALLTFARLARRDHLGATLTTRDFMGTRLGVLDTLGIVTGHNKWRAD